MKTNLWKSFLKIIGAIPVKPSRSFTIPANQENIENKIAAATVHRVCCGTEHDPSNGKLHGYCIVCGIDWPCETARTFLFNVVAKEKEELEQENRNLLEVLQHLADDMKAL